jgi:hypothetical protein
MISTAIGETMSHETEQEHERRQLQWLCRLHRLALAETTDVKEAAEAATLAFFHQPDPPEGMSFSHQQSQEPAPPPKPPEHSADMRATLAALDAEAQAIGRELLPGLHRMRDRRRAAQSATGSPSSAFSLDDEPDEPDALDYGIEDIERRAGLPAKPPPRRETPDEILTLKIRQLTAELAARRAQPPRAIEVKPEVTINLPPKPPLDVEVVFDDNGNPVGFRQRQET